MSVWLRLGEECDGLESVPMMVAEPSRRGVAFRVLSSGRCRRRQIVCNCLI
jgi:hypothetical protein